MATSYRPWLGLLLAASAAAQTLEGERGTTEFVGLTRLSPAQLDQAVAEKCEAHYCAATLEGVLGFAEAAVFVMGGDAEIDRLVVLVEDAAHVRKKALPAGAGAMPASWSGFAHDIEKHPQAFDLAVREYPRLLADGAEAARAALRQLEWAAPELPMVERCWAFLAEHAGAADRTLALWHLDHDPDWAARRLAAAILLDAHGEDVAWWALADALRDPDDRVNGVAWTGLRSLAQHLPRRVDWRPAAASLRAVLAGTQCFAVPDLCAVLVATRVERELAPALLADGGALVLGYAACRAPLPSARARELLCHLAGRSEDAALDELRDWVGGLSR